MYKDLLWKAALVVFMIAVSCIYVYPPSEKLKQGIELAGGTSLIYEIDASDLSPADRKGLAEKMIPILLKRIDPTHVANIIMRPQGNTRIEIQLPVASLDTIKKRKAFEDALLKLENDNINLLQIKRSLSLPAEQRTAELAKFTATSPERKEKIDALVAIYDKRSKKQVERDELSVKIDSLKKQASEMGLKTDFFDAQIASWIKATPDKQATEIAEFLKNNLPADAKGKPDEVKSVIAQYLAIFQEWSGVVSELTDPGKGLNVEWNKAVADLGGVNLNIDTLRQVLEMSPKSAKRVEMLDSTKKNFASRKADIDAVVSTYDTYFKVGGKLDDPEDLKRMLKGSGVLEFRILPTAGEVDAAAQQEALATKGPKGASSAQYVWCEVEDPAVWHTGIYGRFGDKVYVLASNLDSDKMTQGKKAWKLKRSYPTNDQDGRRAIGFNFDDVAANLFFQLTSSNLQKPLCILLDNIAISAPNINSAISSSGVITGKFSQVEIEDMVNKLNAGSFPARLSEVPISEKTFGPSIGAANRTHGVQSAIYALIAVSAFMFIYYLVGGAISDIALALNVLFLLAIMSLLRATFTMGGIAGMVLTMGMCVDANVLIFERMREEQRRGSSVRATIANGYHRAFRTIIDAHLTAFIPAFILFFVASEEIKGFALVLMIGIGSTLFTSLFITRIIFDFLTRKGWISDHLTMMGLFQRININWMKLRPFFFTISGVLMIAGLIIFFMRGESKYDIEFTGGTTVQIDLKQGTGFNENKVREIFAAAAKGNKNLEAARIIGVGTTGLEYEITTTETNRTTALVKFNQAGQTVQSLTEKLNIAEDTIGFELSKLVIDAKDGQTFEVMTSRVNPSMIKQVLVSAVGQDGTVNEPVVDEVVTNTVRKAFGPYLAAQENLNPEVVSVEKIADGSSELANFLGGIKIVCKINKETSAEDIINRVKEIRFKSDMQNFKWYRYEILGANLEALSPTDKVTSFVFVSVHPEAGYRELAETEWTTYVENEKNKLIAAISLESTLSRVTQFDPSVGNEAKTRALIAIILSILGIVTYIWIRFGTARYGIGTIASLVHDVIITLGLVVSCTYIADTALGRILLIEDFKINLEMIAAFLTLIGFSMNDTVVVFDRIRENRGKDARPTPQIINDSINQTLSRTILTSVATWIAVFVMYVWGGSGFRGFNFAMLFGILVGTYSSIAIAAPILILGGSKKSEASR